MGSYVMFCSSDSRPAYVQDIKRVIALPSNFIFRFRYQAQHVDNGLIDTIKRNPKALCEKKGFIAYTTGNSINPESPMVLNHLPIRLVEIKKAVIDEDTALVYFYLKLGAFCHCQNGESLPTTTNFSIKEVSAILCETNFKAIAESLSFSKTTLVHISGVYRMNNGNRVPINDNPDDESSYFDEIREGKRYKMELAAYSDSSDISYDLDSSRSILFDQKIVRHLQMKLDKQTHTFKADKSEERTCSSPVIVNVYENSDAVDAEISDTDKIKLDHDVMLNCKISKSFWSSFLFGILATLSAIGIFLVTSARTEASKAYEFSWLQLAIGAILLCVVAGSLYLIYNKK